MDDKEFLQWIYERLLYVYHENENVDYMHRLKKIIESVKNCATCGDTQCPEHPRRNPYKCGKWEPRPDPLAELEIWIQQHKRSNITLFTSFGSKINYIIDVDLLLEKIEQFRGKGV